MKRILFLFAFLTSVICSFAQTGPGNDSSKYVWYRYNYGQRQPRIWLDSVLIIPKDTAFSKSGIARKGTTLYYGDGTKWTAFQNGTGGGGGAVSSVFGRTGAVSALDADYEAFYPKLTGAYNDPSWITGLNATKINGRLGFSQLPEIPSLRLLGRTSPFTGDVQSLQLTDVLDAMLSNSVGSIPVRGTNNWEIITGNPDSSDVLTYQGVGKVPKWVPVGGPQSLQSVVNVNRVADSSRWEYLRLRNNLNSSFTTDISEGGVVVGNSTTNEAYYAANQVVMFDYANGNLGIFKPNNILLKNGEGAASGELIGPSTNVDISWTLPNTTGFLGNSVRINGVTTPFNATGLADLGTIAGGGSQDLQSVININRIADSARFKTLRFRGPTDWKIDIDPDNGIEYTSISDGNILISPNGISVGNSSGTVVTGVSSGAISFTQNGFSQSFLPVSPLTRNSDIRIPDSTGTLSTHVELNGVNYYSNSVGKINLGTISSGGITSLNGLSGATQAFVNDANIGIASTGTTHTINWIGTLADGRIASAATWNGKQNAFASLTTFGNLAAAPGLLRNNGSNVLSWDATAYATQQALADSMAGLSKFNINKDYDSLATTEINGDLTLHSIDFTSGSTAITASKILGSRNNRYSVLFNPANVAMSGFSGTITNSRISDFQSGVRNNISLTTTGKTGPGSYTPGTGVINMPDYATPPVGGTTGQVLKKVSNTDYDYSWQADNTGGGGTVLTTNSIQGDGQSGTEVKLVGDVASPGNNKVYGTSSAGVRGYQNASVINLTSPANGDFLKYNSALSEWNNLTPGQVKIDLALNNVTNESKATMFTAPTITGALMGGEFSLTGTTSPAQYTADQNDVSYTGTSIVRVNSNSDARVITSVAGGIAGRMMQIVNVGQTDIVIQSDDGATGTAGNRFDLNGHDVVIEARDARLFMYDATLARWVKLGHDFDLTDARRQPMYTWDYMLAGVATANFTTTAISTGTATYVNGITDHPGYMTTTSSATANSGNHSYLYNLQNSLLFKGGEVYECVFQPKVAGNTATTIRFGFMDQTTSADAVDGAYFEIPAGSFAIVGKTSNNSTRTTSATIATLAVNTWYRAKVAVNRAGTSITFTVYDENGVSLGSQTNSANIPTTSGREFGAGFIATNSGTVATLLNWLDYQSVQLGTVKPLKR